MTVLQLDKVSVKSREDSSILRDVSFRCCESDKVLLQGPSGAGKSTLLRAIMGGIPLSSGRVLFRGEVLGPSNIHHFRRQVSYIPQEPILGATRVREALLLPFSFQAYRERSPDSTRQAEVLERVGLDSEILDKKSEQLSGGERQRLVLARSLLLKHRIFLLDEVTASLDEESEEKVIKILAHGDFTVLAVAHRGGWEREFSRVLNLKDGRLKEVEEVRSVGN